MTTLKFAAALALIATQASAAIAENGIWTGNDWNDSNSGVKVVNGVPTSDDPLIRRRINSTLSIDGPIDDIYLTLDNVQRIEGLLTQDMWDAGFPFADPIYTRDNFLRAAAKFPYFCNETNLTGMSVDDTCKRELAAIFAHWGQETGKREPGSYEFWQQALYFKEELGC